MSADLGRLFTAVSMLSAALTASAACTPPPYQLGQVLENDDVEVDLQISISLEDFAPSRLVCLAGALARTYPGRNLWIGIFSDDYAAQNFVPSPEQTDQTVQMGSKFHGVYQYNKEKHDDYLLMMPYGLIRTDSPLNTRIDLPVTGTPACRLAISGRCLLELSYIGYPYIDGKTLVSGHVTLTGRIGRNGVIEQLIVANAEANPPTRRSVLADSAMRNLRTWRFEPSRTNNSVRITYYFDITDSPATSEVQMLLPNEVRVQAKPVR